MTLRHFGGRASACAALLLALSCHRGEVAPPAPAVEVAAIEVTDGAVQSSRNYVGVVEGASTVPVSFAGGGCVTSLQVKEGQQVRAGDLLGTVDSRNAASALNAAKATLDRARDGYSRARMVHDKGSLPDIKWVEAQTQYNQAQSTYDIAQRALEDCRLYAPVGGTVSRLRCETGSRVAPGAPVMEIVDLSRLYVRMSIPEVDVGQVHSGQRVSVRIRAAGGRDKEEGCLLHGTVEELDIVPDPLSHTYSFRVRLSRTLAGVLPGMVCACSIETPGHDRGIELPARAVQLANDGSRYVWVASAEGLQPPVARRRTVTIGDLTATGVLVTGGLESGDKVVTDGMLKLSEGTTVRY